MRRVKEFSIVVLAFALLVGVCWAIDGYAPYNTEGTRVEPGQLHTAKNTWVAINTTSATSTEPSDLADTERTYQTVVTAIAAASSGDEKITIYDVPPSWNGVRLRCRGTTENQNIIHYIYFGTLGDGNRHTDSTSEDCELAYAGNLDWTLGDQTTTDSTYDEMADTLTVTPGEWNRTWGSQSPTGDRVAEAAIDLIGADLIVVVTQTAGCDSQLIAKGY